MDNNDRDVVSSSAKDEEEQKQDDYPRRISLLENQIGYHFKSLSLLDLALTHRSYHSVSEKNLSADTHEACFDNNERLEFLGDSVIGLVVCDYLYSNFPEMREDRLSKIKSYIVSQKNLSVWAESIGLGESIKLSDSERHSGGATKGSIISGCFESVVGAVFLDGGFEAARTLVKKFLDRMNFDGLENDPKSELQEISQEHFGVLPVYKILNEEGPAHEKIFDIEVEIQGKPYGRGRGRSKKDAQKAAAEDALKRLKDKD